MSNVGSHIFEVRNDYCWFRGTVERETAQTWFFTNGRRKSKSTVDVAVPADVDPAEAGNAFRETIRAHSEQVKAAQDAFLELARQAKSEAIAAMLSARSNRGEEDNG